MLKYIIQTLLCSCIAVTVQAASYQLHGKITDSAGIALPGASVSLLYPADSTLAVFDISNKNGEFSISEVKEGSYLLQVAMMGYYTEYRFITLPAAGGDHLGIIPLLENKAAHLLNEVVISGEKVPVRLKGDTLEYNAGSYKVKPDAVAEDLLRKLPGVQVDQEGNIKAMGKNVSKVLVDGKEFFGDDPKVATKNLPADAIDKVQTFERKSEEAFFSGIDDGEREQTLNLILKEGKKEGYFGTAKAGLGLPEHYDATLRAFQFRPKSQVAVLGMLNNINKFGFTLQDYIDFNGGLGSVVQQGGTLNLQSGSMPVDFGQPIPGKVSSGAAGLNYSIEPWKKSRLHFNYMGSGLKKFLDQWVSSRNYTPDKDFEKVEHTESNALNLNHRLAATWRNQVDSVHLITLNVSGQSGGNKEDSRYEGASYVLSGLQNSLDNRAWSRGNSVDLDGSVSWLKKRSGPWSLLQVRLGGIYTQNRAATQWDNSILYGNGAGAVRDNQYRNQELVRAGSNISMGVVRTLGGGFFLEPSVTGRFVKETAMRQQGPATGGAEVTDSLSPHFYLNILTLSPQLALKSTRKHLSWNIALGWEAGGFVPFLKGQDAHQRHYQYLLPSAWWQRDLSAGKRLALRYHTQVNVPGALQLLPVVDYSNPLLRTRGNPDLQPEYAHRLNLDYHHFDAFSMTTFYIMMSGGYVKNKMDWRRVVQPDLSQDLDMVNTPYALQMNGNSQYGKPIQKWRIHINVGLQESWSSTITPVNGVNNLNNTWGHQLELRFNNLNNDQWDIRWGGSLGLSTTRFSLNSELNNVYYHYAGFLRIEYRPAVQWSCSFSGDITHYAARSFDDPVTVPLLKADCSRYLGNNQRTTITLSAFDLLNRNRSVQRTSQVNNLMEQRTNVMGRYALLSLAYKLNKVGRRGQDGIQLKMP